jgi:hypothetical protein
MVDTTVELGQLVLQITQSNIDVDPEKIDISPVEYTVAMWVFGLNSKFSILII